jgi:hypothetical protein
MCHDLCMCPCCRHREWPPYVNIINVDTVEANRTVVGQLQSWAAAFVVICCTCKSDHSADFSVFTIFNCCRCNLAYGGSGGNCTKLWCTLLWFDDGQAEWQFYSLFLRWTLSRPAQAYFGRPEAELGWPWPFWPRPTTATDQACLKLTAFCLASHQVGLSF